MYIKANRASFTSDWNNFREAAAAARKTCKGAYKSLVSKAFSGNGSTNPWRFFSIYKINRCKNNGVAPLREDGTKVINNGVKAHVLNSQFCSEYTKEDFRTPKLTLQISPEMREIKNDIEGIKQLMKNLDPLKVDGPDMIKSQF